MRIVESEDMISVEVDGVAKAVLSFYTESDVCYVTKTYVDASLRGQGIASKLMDALIEKARRDGFKIKPICSYAASYFEKHPESNDLLALREYLYNEFLG